MKNSEQDYIAMLKSTDLVQQIGQAIASFEQQHGVKPTVVFINRGLRTPLTRVLVQVMHIPAEQAIVFPFFLDNIPICLSDLLVEHTAVLVSAEKGIREYI